MGAGRQPYIGVGASTPQIQISLRTAGVQPQADVQDVDVAAFNRPTPVLLHIQAGTQGTHCILAELFRAVCLFRELLSMQDFSTGTWRAAWKDFWVRPPKFLDRRGPSHYSKSFLYYC